MASSHQTIVSAAVTSYRTTVCHCPNHRYLYLHLANHYQTMARMTSMDIESSPPSFEFNFELPSPYAAISEQTQKSLPWDAKQEPRAGREDNSRADITKDTIKSSETSSTPSAGRDSATGKRKRSNHAQHTRDGAGNKKRKTIGRPKNDWTPSRQRKLIRLYLMTDLTVEEIIRVLRRRGFAPR